jgi:Fe-Mn family superoxide dismutase
MMFSLPQLPYAYDALAPAISEEIMTLHHSKHHQAYVDKLNAALQEAQLADSDRAIEDILMHLDDIPERVRMAVRNNGGGHYNHSLFWQCMTPGGAPLSADSTLRQMLEDIYGSMDACMEVFSAKAAGVFGSGWVWLMPSGEIVTSQNQDSPLMGSGVEPLLGLDVWEHAYYLDYKNVRPEYVTQWWTVVNWKFVQQRYSDATNG